MSKIEEKLINAGLSLYEAKVYNTLMSIDIATAREISDESNVPRSKIYDVLSSLISKGFCSELTGKVKKFKAMNPKYAFNQVISKLEEQQEEVKSISTFLQPLFDELQQDKALVNIVEILHTRNALIEKVDEMVNKSKKQILSFSCPPYMIAENDTEWTSVENHSNNSPVNNKTIYQIEYNRLDDFLKMAKQSQQKGDEVRLISELPMKFFIFDDQAVIFLLAKGENRFSKLLFMSIENSGLAKTLTVVFNLYWSQGITIEEFEKQQGSISE